MSIGDTLATGRHAAGLTVAQVSELTRIREAIIRGIERDDFSACGGDIYARGHIRSIARVIGADAESLVGEYDAVHGAPQPVDAAAVFEPSTPDPAGDAAQPQLECGHGAGPGTDRRFHRVPRVGLTGCAAGHSAGHRLSQDERDPAPGPPRSPRPVPARPGIPLRRARGAGRW